MNKEDKIKSKFKTLGIRKANDILDRWIDEQEEMGRHQDDNAVDDDNCIFHSDIHCFDYSKVNYYLCVDCCYSALYPANNKTVVNILNTRIK